VLLTSYEIAFGRPGNLRSFQSLLGTALIGFLIVLVAAVTNKNNDAGIGMVRGQSLKVVPVAGDQK
jgi:hypothetical protein